MTNFEWFKKKIAESNVDDFYEEIWYMEEPWCDYCCDGNDCKECYKEWANKTYENSMPELKTGMFVEVENCGFGVVVNDGIVFQEGTLGRVEQLKHHIVKVFETYCFMCYDDDVGIIWERN